MFITVYLYGSAQAKENARIILENQPYIKRMDAGNQPNEYILVLTETVNENILIPLLAKCGLGGIRILS